MLKIKVFVWVTVNCAVLLFAEKLRKKQQPDLGTGSVL